MSIFTKNIKFFSSSSSFHFSHKKNLSWLYMTSWERLFPQQISQKYEFIPDTVKTLDLTDNKIIGVIGDNADIDALARNMVIQIAALHSYTDVKMSFLFDEHFDLEWVRWLPHVFSNDIIVFRRFSGIYIFVMYLCNEFLMR